jgi:hypothetical protein
VSERSSLGSTDVLLHALELLGVDHLVDPALAEKDPRRLLQITSVIGGVAEGQSIAYASQVMKKGDETALEAADDLGYRATRLLARDERAGEILWSLWTLRRLVHRLRQVLRHRPDSDVESSLVALRAVHALLSSAVYDGPEVQAMQDDMRKQAGGSARELSARLG